MEAQCHCGVAAKGRARDVLRLLENHNCPNIEEEEEEPRPPRGFQPNPQ